MLLHRAALLLAAIVFTVAVILPTAATPTTRAVAPATNLQPASSYAHILSHSLVDPHQAISFFVNFTDPVIQEYIHNRYGSDSHVRVVRDAVPRFGGPNTISDDPKYVKEIILLILPGAILFVLTLLIWILWACGTCLCGKPQPEGYTRGQILAPIIAGVLCSFVVIGFAIAGIYYSERFDTEITGSNGLGEDTLRVLTHIDGFFDRFQQNMQNVSNQVTNASHQLSGGIQNFTMPHIPEFLASFSEFGVATENDDPTVVAQADPIAFPTPDSYRCPACAALGASSLALANNILSQTGNSSALGEINTAHAAAQSGIVEGASQVQAAIAQASVAVQDIRNQATQYNGDVRTYKSDADKYEKDRRPVVLILFVVPLIICGLFYLLCVCLKSEFTAKVLIHFMFFFGCFLWLMFAIHLPFSLLAADGCHYLDVHEVDLTTIHQLPADITGPLTACLAQRSILDALDINDDLAFVDTVTFPTLPDVTGLLNTTAFDTLNQQVQALTVQTAFPTYDPTLRFQRLTSLNAITNVAPWYEYYVVDNVTATQPDPLKFISHEQDVRQYRNDILTNVQAEAQLQTTLTGIQANMTRVNNEFISLQAEVAHLVNVDIGGLLHTLDPVLDAAKAVKAQALCNPLDTDYQSMKSTFCDDMIISISGLAMCSFFVALFLFGLNVSSWFLIYRLSHLGELRQPKTNEQYGQAQAMPPHGMTVGQGGSLD